MDFPAKRWAGILMQPDLRKTPLRTRLCPDELGFAFH